MSGTLPQPPESPPPQPKQRVLIAIDASDHSEYAFKFYLDTLHHPQNQLVFFHCTEPPYIGTGLGVAGQGFATADQYEHVMFQRREDVKKLRQHYVALLKGADVDYKLNAIEFGGNPGEAIVKMAETERVDLVIMGSRGLGKLRRTILGSVSDYVMNHVHCPVLICQDPRHQHQHHHHHHLTLDGSGFHYKKMA